MCTAVTYKTNDFYFGRTLDYEYSYGEEIAVMPRGFELSFTRMGAMKRHFAIIGVAHIENGYPLFYDAANEKGLAMAGLNFVGNAFYREQVKGRDNVAQYELIPWILGQCSNLDEARALIGRLNITPTPFSDRLPSSPLHWLIADKSGAVVLESVKEGIRVYDNPAGVLTNNPPFDMQMFNLNNYMQLSNSRPKNNFSSGLPLSDYSRGMGAIGLPGDMSSVSRFVRAAFVRANSVSDNSESASVSQFFHILDTVAQPRGCCDIGGENYEITIYGSCCNTDKGIYYYTTYDNRGISAVDMRAENLGSDTLITYPMLTDGKVHFQNRRTADM